MKLKVALFDKNSLPNSDSPEFSQAIFNALTMQLDKSLPVLDNLKKKIGHTIAGSSVLEDGKMCVMIKINSAYANKKFFPVIRIDDLYLESITTDLE